VAFEVTLPEEKDLILARLDDILDHFDDRTEAALSRWRHAQRSV
jgi:hypothetical protein